jgi:hypothetical protein
VIRWYEADHGSHTYRLGIYRRGREPKFVKRSWVDSGERYAELYCLPLAQNATAMKGSFEDFQCWAEGFILSDLERIVLSR